MRRLLTCQLCASLMFSAGCGSDTSGSELVAISRSSHSVCATGSDDWKPHANARVEALDGWDASPTLGLASTDADIFAFDGALTRVARFGLTGDLRGHIGREGDGPGEFRPPRSGGSLILPRGATTDWLAVQDDTVVAFDGRRLQAMTAGGDYIADLAEPAWLGTGGAPRFSSRLRVRSDTVFLDIESQVLSSASKDRGTRSFNVWQVVKGRPPLSIASVVLQRLPTIGNGGPYLGPREATPLWDIQNGCIVISDGGHPHLLLVHSTQRELDTLAIELPTREVSLGPDETSALLRKLGQEKPPAPGLPRRVRRMIVSPDGWVWIEPIQPAGLADVEVIRVNLGTGLQRTDTVPFFPSAFGAPGEMFSIVRSRSGGYAVRRTLLRVGSG